MYTGNIQSTAKSILPMMDYNDILQRIGSFGKFQKILILLVAVPVMFDALTTLMLNFLLGNQLYRCRFPGEDGEYFTSNMSSPDNSSVYRSNQCSFIWNGTEITCTDWVYDQTFYKSTLVSKFNMVCTDTIQRSHILLAHFLGQSVSALVCGFMCDTWGRKPVLATTIFLLSVPNIIRPWMPNLILVAVCEFFNAAGSNFSYFVPFMIATELVGPTHRVLVSFIIYFSYCIGQFILLVYAYFIRDWEDLILAISIPITTSFFILIYVTESPRWLLTTGQGKKAMEIFRKAAKCNKTKVDFKEKDIGLEQENSMSLLRGITEMVKSRTMLVRLFILCFNWFSISLIYYGISMNVGDLGGNVYINYALSGTAETVAVIFCFFADKFPRKKLFCVSMVIGGSSCLSTIFSSMLADKSFHWITVGLAMIGKLGVTTAFFLVFIITSEVFPTVIRATVFGVCNTSARLGALASSYIGKLGLLVTSKFGLALPLIIFGSISTTAGLIALWLPETRRIKLPETLEDALNIDSRTRALKKEIDNDNEVLTELVDGTTPCDNK